ncbi:MAG: hypothetical protein BZY80_02910 [SAR202 cluster bacterium Io17-Chloro-G2]|nr:MAG: hypothetical protein BZY80_02910 [SAR202 cluster bacterium Io17-Chloro-G2]
MRRYTTEEVLGLMEAWFEEHRDARDFDPLKPFLGFDKLLGADLSGIDLGSDTVRDKARVFRENHPQVESPPWLARPDVSLSLSVVEPGLELSGSILSDPGLGKRANLGGAQLQGANLQGVQLQGANLQNARLQGAHILEADLQRADLYSAQLQGANLYRANLSEAGLGSAQLRGAGLVRAQLQGAMLSDAQLEGAFLDRAQLQEATLAGAHLRGADLLEANLQGADLTRAQLEEAVLQQAQLQGADLRWTHLQGARLREAQLQGAHLRGADFKEARLEEVDWTGGYVLAEEDPGNTEVVYRELRRWYTNAGQYEHAGEFHKRQMLMRRKNLWAGRTWADCLEPSFSKKLESFALFLLGLFSGYGERPSWVLLWAVACWLGFGLAYYVGQGTSLGSGYGPAFLGEALYYSALPFSAFNPPGTLGGVPPWASTLAVVQGILTYFLLALFLVTFVQKASRS